MASSSTVSVRFSVDNAQAVIDALNTMGEKGAAAAEKFNQALAGPTAGQKALNAAVEEGTSKFNELAGSLGPLGSVLTAIGPAGLAAGVGIATLYEAGEKLFDVFAEGQTSMARIEGILKATGDQSGLTATQFEDLAVSLSQSSLESKNSILQAEAVLATFGDVSGDTFERVMQAAVDLSATGMLPLQESVVKLGLMMEDPLANMTKLQRAGVELTDTQKQQIQSFMDLGDKASAQNIELLAVESRSKDLASTMANTLTGALHTTGAAWEQLIETTTSTSFGKGFFAGVQSDITDIGDLARWLTNLIDPAQKGTAALLAEANAALALAEANAAATPGGKYAALGQQQIQDAKDHLAVVLQQIATEKDHAAAIKAVADAHNQDQIYAASLAKTEADLENAESGWDQVAAARLAASQAASDQAVLENQQRQQTIAALGVQADAAERLLEAYSEGTDQFNAVQLQLKIEADLRSLGTAATKQQTQAVIDFDTATAQSTKWLADHQQADQAAADQAQKSADQIAAAAKSQYDAEVRFAQQAGSQVVDAFINMATGAKNPFDNLLNYAKKTFAEIAADAILNPIIIPIITDAIGGIGSLIGGASGSGGAAGTASNLLSAGSGVYTLSGGSTGLFSNIGASAASAINSFGTSIGFGSSITTAGVGDASIGLAAGPATTVNYAGSSSLLGGSSLTQFLGAGALGAVGGGLFASLIGGNQTLGSIGGGAGALLGLEVGGPIGAAVGGLIGSLASLFGGKPSNKAQGGIYDPTTGISTAVGFGGDKYDATNAQAASQFTTTVASFVTSLQQASGGTVQLSGSSNAGAFGETGSVAVSAGSRDGVQVAVGGQNATFAVGDVQDAMNWVMGQIANGLVGASADVSTALQHIDWTGDVQTNLSLVQFANNFQSTIKSMEDGTLDITSDAYAKAVTAVQGYVTQIQQFKDTTAQLGLSTADADTATQDFVEQLVGLKTVTAPDALQQQIQTLNGTFAAIGPLLTEVGLDASQSGALLQQAMDSLSSTELQSLTTQDNSILNKGYLNDISTAIASFNGNVTDLQALNDNTAPASKLFDDTLTSIIDKFVQGAGSVDDAEAGLQAILSTFSTMPDVVAAANAALSDIPGLMAGSAATIKTFLTDMSAEQVTAYQTQLTAAQSLLTSVQNISTSAASALTSLETGSLSDENPEQQRDDLLTTLQDAYTASQTDTGAAQVADQQTILNTWQPFLTASQAYYRTSAQYYADEDYVKSILTDTQSSADNQVTLLQTQVDQLNTLITVAQSVGSDLSSGVSTLSASARGTQPSYTVQDLADLGTAYNTTAAGSGLSALDFANSSAGQSFLTAQGTILSGLSDQATLDNYYQYGISDESMPGWASIGTNQASEAAAQLTKLGLPIPQFASGGIVTSRTLAMIGEGGMNEAVVPLPDGRSIPLSKPIGSDSSIGDVGNKLDTLIGVATELLATLKEAANDSTSNLSSIKYNTAVSASARRRRVMAHG